MRDTEKIQAVMDFIKDHPEKHEQTIYFEPSECGSVGCFLGWAAELYGEQCGYFRLRSPNFRNLWVGPDGLDGEVTLEPPFTNLDDGSLLHVSTVGSRILGLAKEEEFIIEAGGNTLAVLDYMVKDLCNGAMLQEIKYYKELAGEE